jgi:hypothetical protein
MEMLTQLQLDLNIPLITSDVLLAVGSTFIGIGLILAAYDYKKLKKTIIKKDEEIAELKEKNNKLNKELTIDDGLMIISVIAGAALIIKGILDGEDPIKEISDFVQKNVNRQDSNMGSVG